MEFKKVDDYIDKVAEKYDKIPKDVIKKVIDFGLRAYYRINAMGGDILLKSPYFTAYTGKFFHPDKVYDFGKYRLTKLMIKNRIQYIRKNKHYSGYYYFGMTEDRYAEYKDYIGKTGKRHEKVKFEKLYIYKLFDEVFNIPYLTRFFRVEIPKEGYFKEWKDELITSKFDYIGKKIDKKFISVDYEKRNK